MTTRLSLLRNAGLLALVAFSAPLLKPSAAQAAMVCIVEVYDDGIACAACFEGACWGAACSDGETTISTGGCDAS